MDQWTSYVRSWFQPALPILTFCWTWILTFYFFIKGVDVDAMDVSIFRIFYVILALLFILLFQLSRELWQKIIIIFWVTVLIYSAFVAFANILFQFRAVRELSRNLGLNQQWQKSIGLHTFELGELISFMLIELLVIVLIIILSLLLHKVNPVSIIHIKYLEKLVEVLDTFFDITKLTVFGIMMACISRLSVINLCLLIAAVISMILGRMHRFIIILLISLTSAVILLSQMIVQLSYFTSSKEFRCLFGNKSVNVNIETWMGIGKMNPNESILYYVIGYVFIIALVTIYTVVVKEDNLLQGLINKSGWNPHKMFQDVIYLNSHKDFYSYIKYLLKYGFYRYGIEFTYIFIALLIQARLDFWALVYSIWLVIFVLCPNGLSIIWKIFKYFLAIVIPLQYAVSLGIYPIECMGFDFQDNQMYKNVFQWLFLPIGDWKPDRFSLFWDSVVFLFTLCQANVFYFKNRIDINELAKISPTAVVGFDTDSVIRRKTTFGLIRYTVFCSLRNLAAVAFFFAGTKSITIFSLLYGIGFAAILWNTDDYYVHTSKRTKRIWKYLLVISVLIIFVKVCLQIPGCIFMGELVTSSCWLVQLFGISCFKSSSRTIVFLKVPIFSTADVPENACWVLPTSVSIEWDIICFIALIFHQRFLQSEYYVALAKEDELNKKFSFKAAEILEELNRKDIKELQEKYAKNFKKIQKNMKRLEESQKRIRGIIIREPETHQEAITSGDYYMFQDDEKTIKPCISVTEFEHGEDDTEKEKSADDETVEKGSPNIGKLMEAVMKSDIESAVKLTAKTEKSPVPDELEELKLSSPTMSEHQQLQKKPESKKKECSCEDVFETEKYVKTMIIKFKEPSSPDEQLMPGRTKGEPMPANRVKSETIRKLTVRKGLMLFKFMVAFFNSSVVSICQFCNVMARDYKYVTKQLNKEKYANQMVGKDGSPALSIISQISVDGEKTPTVIRLLICLYDLMMSRFNAVCFFAVFLLQIRNPTYFSLLLTLMVLCWGALSVPRPTKRFWKLILLYTTVLLLLECIFRSQLTQSIYTMTAEFLALEKIGNYSVYYLIVIMTVMWQRSKLKSIGLWNTPDAAEWRGNLFRMMYLSVKHFFEKLLCNTAHRIPVDIYTHMFFCDFINIFVFIFGFASITERHEDGVSRYFYENKIPPALLLLFVIQCLTIFLDRWIYLRRHVIAKLILQFVQIVVVHMSLFIVLPAFTLQRFNQMFFPGLWYCIKCIYFLLSAYQIRSGYPASVHGHALCQSYNVLNLHLYQIYLIFPFVYELRTVTDWMWTETTLTLSEWLSVEDIFCTVFILKCWRNYDNKYSYRRGSKITNTVKFTVGGGIVLLFFSLLIFPLAFFTFGRVAGKQNIPEDMKISIRIGSLEPFFTTYTTQIRSFTVAEWLLFQDLYRYSPPAITFLSEYYYDDVGVIRFMNYSTTAWILPPLAKDDLLETMRIDKSIELSMEWTLNRKAEDAKRSTIVSGRRTVMLSEEENKKLINVLGNDLNNVLNVENLAPRFLKVSSSSRTSSIEVLQLPLDDPQLTYMNVTLRVKHRDSNYWWQAYVDEKLRIPEARFLNAPNDNIIMYTFNDKIFSSGIISYVSAQGILGLYTTFLISLGFLIRRLCRGRTNQIFLDYIPNVDCILQLLLDIYFVREHRDGILEEDLFAKLIFLFRSPETIIQWTRQPIHD